MVKPTLFLFVSISIVAIQVHATCPPLTATSGATWIYVEWNICEDDAIDSPSDVMYYQLDIIENTISVHNLTSKPYCRAPNCAFNQTLALPCADYTIMLTLVTNDEEQLEYEPQDITTLEVSPSAPMDLAAVTGGDGDTCLDITWSAPDSGVFCVTQYNVSVWSLGNK